MNVIIRSFKPDEDTGIIYETWPKTVYHASHVPIETKQSTQDSKDQWFRSFFPYMQDALEQLDVRIACLKDEPNMIVGYCILDDETLEWVYVKEPYRKLGVATLLIPKSVTKYKFVTKLGHAILEGRKKKENLNGRTNHANRKNKKEDSRKPAGEWDADA